MQQGNNKPYPPFGSELNLKIKLDISPEYGIFIFCGKNAWHQAKLMNRKSTLALCLPPNVAPEAYNWIAQDLSFIVSDTGDMNADTLRMLGFILLDKGAKSVVIESDYLNLFEVY